MLNVRIPAQEKELSPRIIVIGVGGAGGNAVDNMIASDLAGVDFLVCNTDAQAIKKSLCPNKVQLGTGMTQGLGAGSKPEVGRAAAEESFEDVIAHLEGMNMAFITCGMGGGTGTGAAPIIARAAKEKGILTVGVVTKPFHFEGAHRMRIAEAGIEEMQDYVDTLIVIPNQNLFRIANEKTTFAEAFKMADSVLQSGVRGVTDLMLKPGLINLDFADVRCAMMEMGKAMMGTGEATGESRAIEAAEAAISNPLLDDVSMKGARGVIINITGGYDMTLFEADEACNRIRDEVDPNANIIFGSTFDDKLEGVMRVSVVATGIDSEALRKSKPLKPATMNVVSGQTVQTERKAPERSVPNAESARPVSHQTSSFSPSYAQSPSMPSFSAPVAAPHNGGGTRDAMPMSRQDDPEQDMFEQASYQQAVGQQSVGQQPMSQQGGQQTPSASRSFGGAPMGAMPVAPTEAAPSYSPPVFGNEGAYASSSSMTVGSAEALRGVRYGSSFIPPKPMEAHDSHAQAHSQHQPAYQDEAAQNFGSRPQFQGQPAMQAQSHVQTHVQTQSQGQAQGHAQSHTMARPAGLKLNPPQQPRPEDRKKSPSLFERFTGAYRNFRGEDDGDLGQTDSQGSGSQGGNGGSNGGGGSMFSGLRSQPTENGKSAQSPVQGQLDVNVQQKAEAAKGDKQDLDIPAFLRRQAN